MSSNRRRQGSGFTRTVKKFSVSAFMVITFITYALHERFVSASAPLAAGAKTPTNPGPQQVAPTQSPLIITPQPAPVQNTGSTAPAAPAAPQPAPSATPAPTVVPPTAAPAPAVAQGQYKDGTFTGQPVDAFYGQVQVQAVVKNGKLTDVQFTQYPNDRRTSVRINSIAMPYLTQEAVQAQSANVDIISGATLTSQAFAESLQTALDSAARS